MIRRIITPAGRKDRLSILYEYIKMSYQNDEIDEWVLFKNTDDIDDLEYIDYLEKTNNFIRICEIDESYRVKMSNIWSKEWALRVGYSKTLTDLFVKRFFPIIILTMQYYSDQDVVYVKMDDDIVYIKPGSIGKLIEFKLKNKEHLFSYGNILNNSVCHHFHQKYGNIEFDKYQKLGVHDNGCHRDPLIAFKVHNLLLDKLDSGQEDDLLLPNIEIEPDVEFSINVMCWRGQDFKKYFRKLKLLVMLHEEYYLSVQICKDNNLKKGICGEALFSHYSFGPQEEYLKKTNILERYRNYAKKQNNNKV